MTVYVYEDPTASGWIAVGASHRAYGASAHDAFWNLIARLKRRG